MVTRRVFLYSIIIMTGGLINIVSYGSNDLYLTGAPQITFFKIVYRRHTNFSVESIYIDIEDELSFGEESEVNIPPIGDAIHKGYLEIKIPEFVIKKTDVGLTVSQTSTAQLDEKLDNYNKILEFMSLNTKAYRAAYDNIYADNVNVETVIDAALEQFQDAPVDGASGVGTIKSTIIDNYVTLISTTDSLELTLSNNTTSLHTILDNLRNDIENNIILTKDELIIILDKAIDNSIKIQDYFFKETLIHKDEVNDLVSENIKFAWVKRLGHTIIDYIDVFIGGEKIDRHYGMWIDIWYELTGNTNQSDMYAKMIGDVPEMTTFDRTIKPEYKIQLPLNFWFNKHNGLAFPLVALQYSDVVFNIKLKDISKCCYMERITDTAGNELYISLGDVWEDSGKHLDARLMIDYIFMEHLERQKFAQSSHEYLIEVVQHLTYKHITQGKVQAPLDFRHPCKELIWIVQRDDTVKNESSFTMTHNTQYGVNNPNEINPFSTSALDFNGYSRVSKTDGYYFNYYQPMKHRNTPTDGINVYSFGLNPEEHQPSGTCNFSKIPSVIMNFELNPNIFKYKLSEVRPDIVKGSLEDIEMTTSVTIHIFAISYNILRIIGGFGGLAYS